MSRIRRTSWWLAGVGVVLTVGLLLLAQPKEVLILARRAHGSGVLAAFGATVAVVLLRGARLAVLAGVEVRLQGAWAAAGGAQLATGVLPLRLGDLATIPLLNAAGLRGRLRALSVLVLSRVLDVVSVLLWATAAAALIGGRPALGVALLAATAAALAAIWGALTRALRRVARSWRRRPGWHRRALRQLLRIRREVGALARSPLRAGTALLLSLAVWGSLWAVALLLLRAMDVAWSPLPVLLGVLGAAFGSSLPVGSVGNFGTQEAGWVAALASAGIEPRVALAAGFACHLWSVVFAAVVGGAGFVYLAETRADIGARPFLARLKSLLSSERAP